MSHPADAAPPVVARVGLLGAGAQAREIADWLRTAAAPAVVVFRAVDPDYLAEGLVSVSDPGPGLTELPVIAAAGPPAVRRALVQSWPGERFAQCIGDSARLGAGAVLGAGGVLAPGAIVSTDARLGRHVLVNLAATLSHDVVAEDFVTLAPGSHVGGGVHLGAGVWVGIGAVVADGVRLASGVVVGAGATVLHDVDEPNTVVVGVPARPVRVRDGWLDSLARRSVDQGDGSRRTPGDQAGPAR